MAINYSVYSINCDSPPVFLGMSGFTGGSGQYEYAPQTFNSETAANNYNSGFSTVVPGNNPVFSGVFSGQTYWVLARDTNNTSDRLAKSITMCSVDPGVTSTPTPTPTNTPTQTGTAAVTSTPTPTPTNTTTPTNTPTNTTTPTTTSTKTPTPTNTQTQTNTASVTPTPSETPNVCKTYNLNGGTTDTTFTYRDCNGFLNTTQVGAFRTLTVCATQVTIINGNGSYVSIGSCPLPTTTPTSTPTNTPTNTTTPTKTPTNTPTNTTTPTNTPTKTATNTPTPTQTQTGTPSVTSTPTPTKTPTNTPTNTTTPTKTPTNTPTNTQTGTAAVTPTKTATSTPTPTQTGTASVTPTPTPTFFFTGFSADQQYAYTIDILGGFSGGTAPEGAIAPHPIFTDENGVPIQQLNGITLGGFNGLNN